MKYDLSKAQYDLQWDINFNAAHALETARLSRGWTQETLATAMGTQQPSVARVEADRGVSLAFLNRAAKAMGMKVDIGFSEV